MSNLIETKRISAEGESCNFCRRGKVNSDGQWLTPYNVVFQLTSGGNGVTRCNVCPECLDVIKMLDS